MPLRDHFRPPVDDLTSWEGFHGQWPAMLVIALNRKLPRRSNKFADAKARRPERPQCLNRPTSGSDRRRVVPHSFGVLSCS